MTEKSPFESMTPESIKSEMLGRVINAGVDVDAREGSYQAQVEALTASVEGKTAELAEKDEQLAKKDEALAAANGLLAELEATYDEN